jgi:hypothetical protein
MSTYIIPLHYLGVLVMSDGWKVFLGFCCLVVVVGIMGLAVNLFDFLKANISIVWYLLGIGSAIVIEAIIYGIIQLIKHFKNSN